MYVMNGGSMYQGMERACGGYYRAVSGDKVDVNK
jgi:hypothetical protein